MLWNWYTIDACFFSSQWHITSIAAFVASCIGIALLVVMLEFLRRSQRELDRYIARKTCCATTATTPNTSVTKVDDQRNSAISLLREWPRLQMFDYPTRRQQTARAALYMLQFGLAYVIMLLAMSYDGFVIFSILVGAFVGFWVFARDMAATGAGAGTA